MKLLSLFSGIGAFEKAEAVNSNTQLYKKAGNSIVVSVAYYIIKSIIDAGIFDGKADDD